MKKSNRKQSHDNSSDDGGGSESHGNNQSGPSQKQKLLTKVQKSMTQPELKVFRGIQVPFSNEQIPTVHQQFLRATISANLPFCWVEDPEVMKLFLLFRATAGKALLTHGKISGKLLKDKDEYVLKKLQEKLGGKYAVIASDGWKDVSKDSINGVSLSVDGKVSP